MISTRWWFIFWTEGFSSFATACGKIFHKSIQMIKVMSHSYLESRSKITQDTRNIQRQYHKIVKGIQPLNDISRQINETSSIQVAMFMIEVVLISIYACLGYYKYLKVAASYVKWYCFIALTSHTLIIGQSLINNSSKRLVSLFIILNRHARSNNCASRWMKCSKEWEKFQPGLW